MTRIFVPSLIAMLLAGCASTTATRMPAIDITMQMQPVERVREVVRTRQEQSSREYALRVEIFNKSSEPVRLHALSLRQTDTAQVTLPRLKRSYDLAIAPGTGELLEFSAIGHFNTMTPARHAIGPMMVRAEFSSEAGPFEKTVVVQKHYSRK